ncbi:MAG: MFS transporter [Gemmataceae bacterium]
MAALGWLFDCLDQQLFLLARQPAMSELLPPDTTWTVDAAGGYATSIFLIGWATGGLLFGILGDRIGRARTMIITILVYSLCTGLSALSVSFWDFAVYRFLTGLGVGGEFAVGVALVAEVMPSRARPYALASLQALSAVGNISAAFIAIGMGQLEGAGVVDSIWRPMFIVGAVPALLALVIRRRLKEPEQWQRASHEDAVAKKLGSYSELFSNPLWRKHALIGMTMAFSGVVGLWAVGFFMFDLVGNIMEAKFAREAIAVQVSDNKLSEEEGKKLQKSVENTGLKRTFQPIKEETEEETYAEVYAPIEKVVGGQVVWWKGITSFMLNIGAFFGMYTFGMVTQKIGRKPTFALAFILGAASTINVLLFLTDFSQVFWMIPLMGICQLSLFAGYAIYFPELFPTHLRSTGTSFCYNVGRFVAAVGPALLALLINEVFTGTRVERLRYAGLTMCIVFAFGLLVLPFAPETKDKPLPE